MPGTWQYQQSARIPLNPPDSLIRVKNLQSNACLINHKTVEHPLTHLELFTENGAVEIDAKHKMAQSY